MANGVSRTADLQKERKKGTRLIVSLERLDGLVLTCGTLVALAGCHSRVRARRKLAKTGRSYSTSAWLPRNAASVLRARVATACCSSAMSFCGCFCGCFSPLQFFASDPAERPGHCGRTLTQQLECTCAGRLLALVRETCHEWLQLRIRIRCRGC